MDVAERFSARKAARRGKEISAARGTLDFGSGAEYSGMEEQSFLRFLRNTYLSLMGEYI